MDGWERKSSSQQASSSSKQLLGSAESSPPFWPPSHVQERKKDMRSTLRRWKEEDERAHSRRGAQESRDTWMTRQEIQSHSTPRAQLFLPRLQPNGERLKDGEGDTGWPSSHPQTGATRSDSRPPSQSRKIKFLKKGNMDRTIRRQIWNCNGSYAERWQLGFSSV